MRPGSGSSPPRRFISRHARGRIRLPDGDRHGRPGGPTRRGYRRRPPPGPHQPQGRRPEEGQRPDGSGPTCRHARDPLRLPNRRECLLSAPAIAPHRPALRGRTATRGSKVLASFTISHERRSVPAPASGAMQSPLLSRESPLRRRAGTTALIYQNSSAGQSPRGGRGSGFAGTRGGDPGWGSRSTESWRGGSVPAWAGRLGGGASRRRPASGTRMTHRRSPPPGPE